MFDLLLYNPRLSLTVSNRRGFNYLQFAVLKGYKRYVREYCLEYVIKVKKKIIEVTRARTGKRLRLLLRCELDRVFVVSYSKLK